MDNQEKVPLIPGPAPAAYPTANYPTGYPTGYPSGGYNPQGGIQPPGYNPQPGAPQPGYAQPSAPSGAPQPYPVPAPYAPGAPAGGPSYAPGTAPAGGPAPFGAAPPPGSLPPQYSPYPVPQIGTNGHMVVPCRVCMQTIEYTPKHDLSAVRCNNCHHATQVGPPPAGKTFILCQCNTLLTVPLTSRAATCPKEDCRRTIILKPELPGRSRAFCAHCNTLLTYNSRSAVVVCPKCRKKSVVNRSRLNGYMIFYFVMAFVWIGVGVGLTATSYEVASENGGGLYFVFWGLVLTGILWLVRAGLYFSLNFRAPEARIVPV